MTIYFTADTHFGHKKVIGMNNRGANMKVTTITDHDDLLIDNINKTVSKGDILWHLGDYCWEKEGHYRARINVRQAHLIFGNHDKKRYSKCFSTAQDVFDLKIKEGTRIWLSHYAHCYWPASHYGTYHLYGHHHAQREETLDDKFPRRRSMDCGVDNAFRLLGEFRPFSEDEILSFLQPQIGSDSIWFYVEAENSHRPFFLDGFRTGADHNPYSDPDQMKEWQEAYNLFQSIKNKKAEDPVDDRISFQH